MLLVIKEFNNNIEFATSRKLQEKAFLILSDASANKLERGADLRISNIGSRTIAQGNCPLDNCLPDNSPPLDNCPPDNCPPDNFPQDYCPPENCPLKNCFPGNCPRTISSWTSGAQTIAPQNN